MGEWKDITLGAVLKYEQPYKYTVESTQYNNSGVPVLTAGKSFILGYTSETNNLYSNLPVIIFDDFTSDCKFVDFPFKVKSSAMKFLKERNEEEISLKYFYEILQTLKLDSVGGDHKRRWISEYSKIKIKAPDFIEQSHISEILSNADEAIAYTEALIAKYQRIKTGLMQDLLTKGIDVNGNIRSKETHKFVVKNGIEIPEEWEVDIIDNVSKVTKLAGYEFTKYFDYSIGGEIIALRALNIKNEEIILDDIQTIPKKVSDQLPRSKINKGDVLITYIGAYIGDTLLITESNKYHLAPNIAKLTAGNKLKPEFLEIVLKTYPVQKQTKNLTAVTATPSLTMGQIRNIFISFPKEIDEQKRIITTINSMRQNIKDEQNKLHKLHSLKIGLMQDLLSGKVRVNI